jgi:polysaccharide export outer membrane protein
MIRFLVSIVVVGSALACGPSHKYVWADQLPEERHAPETYAIRPGDRLAILVWNQPQLSGPVRVRADGVATVTLVGDLPVAGLTAPDAAEQIKRRLKGLVNEPNVTVTVEEAQAVTVSVIGEVRSSGSYPVAPGETVLHMLARAGGLTEYANPNGIYVVRRDNQLQRVRFRYRDLAGGDPRSLSFVLRDGDVIVVE